MLKIFQAATSLGSDNPGTEKAPEYILEKSLRVGLQHNDIECEVSPALRDLTNIEEDTSSKLHNHQTLVDLNKRLNRLILDSVQKGDVALTLGGDHSVSIGSFFATKQRYPDACIVYIDAHPDCATPDTTLSGNIHGMPVSTVLGDGLYSDFSLPQYKYNEIYMLGIKDIDLAEQVYLEKNSIHYATMDDIVRNGVAQSLETILKGVGSRPLHISLDIDGIDVSEAPGTGIINKGGLSYREVNYVCRHLSQATVVAIDQVEVNPDRDEQDKTTHLAAELVIAMLGGEWSPYTRYMLAHQLGKA